MYPGVSVAFQALNSGSQAGQQAEPFGGQRIALKQQLTLSPACVLCLQSQFLKPLLYHVISRGFVGFTILAVFFSPFLNP